LLKELAGSKSAGPKFPRNIILPVTIFSEDTQDASMLILYAVFCAERNVYRSSLIAFMQLYMWEYSKEGAQPMVVLKTRRSLRAVHFQPHGTPLLLTAEV